MNHFILSLIVAAFVGGVAGYLGSLMIVKRMGLVGGPLGHLALPGVALALIYHLDVFVGALVTITLGGFLIWLLEVKTDAPVEALTGLVFASGVALSFLVLPFSQEHLLEEALVGDIAQISLWSALLSVALSAGVFWVVKSVYPQLVLAEISEDLAKVEGVDFKKGNLIYLVSIGLIVALAVRLVGGLLPVALMVIPALTARNLSRNFREYSLNSLLVGVVAAVLGVVFSQLYDLPAGLLIVFVGSLLFVVSIFFRRLTYRGVRVRG